MRQSMKEELDAKYGPFSGLADMLDNAGLKALTVPEEQKEIQILRVGFSHSMSARAAAAEIAGHKIVFGYFQDDYHGGKIAYWHVTDPTSKSYHSSLSWQGLMDWKVNLRAGRRR